RAPSRRAVPRRRGKRHIAVPSHHPRTSEPYLLPILLLRPRPSLPHPAAFPELSRPPALLAAHKDLARPRPRSCPLLRRSEPPRTDARAVAS
uniref:Uncharacterized protein n=1 Tax=Aegilops tauschii subsp. strangulata TaxID=200361 RepID=A0A453DP88_AEGTS